MKPTRPITVSSRYQIVIPKDVREALQIKPGQRFEVFVRDGAIWLVPLRPMKELRGFLKDLPEFEREPDREF